MKKRSLIQIRDVCTHKSQKYALCTFSMMINFENFWVLGDFELLSSDEEKHYRMMKRNITDIL